MVISKRDAAARLGVSTKTLERKIFDGSIPHYKIGSRILIDPVDLDAYLQKCRQPVKQAGGAE